MPDDSRCTGHCCRDIPLPFSPEELHEKQHTLTDGEYIASMVHYTGVRYEKHGLTFHRYSCTHFDGVSCTAYETRPKMCRDYPYGKPCEKSDCTWEAGRAGVHPAKDHALRQVEKCPEGDARRPLLLAQLHHVYRPPARHVTPEPEDP